MKSEFKKIADDCGLHIDCLTLSIVESLAEQVVEKCCEILDDKRFDNVRPSIGIAQAMIKQFFEIKNE